MLEDSRLRIFDVLARTGSFTLSARELGISQPAVSQNIAELEKTLDAQLFTREKGGVSLTDKGRLFKSYSDQILHWYRAASDAFEGGQEERAVKMDLGDGRKATLWACGGDLHISLSED